MEFITSIKLKLTSLLLICMMLGACSFEKTISIGPVHNEVIRAINILVAWFPPASDLQNFDAQQATQNLSVQNITITANSGTVEINIKDENDGMLIGHNTFSYTINAQNQVSFSDPTTVTNWVRSFSNYNGFVKLEVRTNIDTQGPPQGQSGTVSSTLVYNGAPLASASSTYTNDSGCGAGFCEEQ